MSRRTLTEAERAARRAATWTDAGYRHYDASDGFGSGEEWEAAAEALIFGKAGPRFRESASSRRSFDPDLTILGLDAMPETAQALLSAFRRAAMRTHPDHGGTAAEFKRAYAAYERLARRY
jgi:hypothetical protein